MYNAYFRTQNADNQCDCLCSKKDATAENTPETVAPNIATAPEPPCFSFAENAQSFVNE